MKTVDVLAFGPHPDDVDLNVGGTLLRLVSLGRSCAIVDLTGGELGTRGTPTIRRSEALAAAKVLGVLERRCLDLPDGDVQTDRASREAVVNVLRELRPKLVLAPVERDLHPDHARSGVLIRECCFLAGVRRFDPGLEPHRPRTVLGYANHTVFEPDIVIDVTEWFERKRQACLEFRSQFHDPTSTEPATYIASDRFWDWWEARARHFGQRIGARFGEPFAHDGPIPVADPVALFEHYGYYP